LAGSSWLDAGKYPEALTTLTQALAIREETLGPEHPDVAQTLNILAALYSAQGRYAEAEPLYRRARDIEEGLLAEIAAATELASGGGSHSSEHNDVRASRLFATRFQYPPKDFAAYGIVAFRSAPTEQDFDRYLDVCHAYSAALPHADAMPGIPREEQMVTVWPIAQEREALADALNTSYWDFETTCNLAVEYYDLHESLSAIREAERVSAITHLNGSGPLLLAWAPGAKKGAPDALVLVADLSYITEYDAMRDVFVRWAEDIEQNPELWRRGWRLEQLRATLRAWADRFGPRLLSLVTGGS
jgi:tetratricopeptide (TPR) repeat protein